MKKFIFIILGTIVSVVLIGYLGVNYVIDSTLGQLALTEKVEKEEASIDAALISKEQESNVINIAVFGVDKNGDQTDGRSDAIKVLSLDKKNGRAVITSFQRDTLIYIPEKREDFDKLNHAYAYGGANLAMQTLNYNFDLDLTRYVSFNFEAIEEIIDLMGGLEIDVEEKEIIYIPGISRSGLQYLDGSQVLAYMRIRAADNDYVRMDRQTQVIKIMFAKLTTLKYSELLDLLTKCLPFIETNIPKNEIISLGLDALKLNLANIEQYQVPFNGYDDINQSVAYRGYSPLYILDSYQDTVSELHHAIYGDSTYEPSVTIKNNEQYIYSTFGYQK